MITTIIVDDEADGREALQLVLEKYCPEISIICKCETPEIGLSAIRKYKPDLVFLDVQMPHLSGFDLLQQLSPVTFEVIFVSAYDRYAIKAIKFSALDYLLKPVDAEELISSISKVKERLDQKSNAVFKYQSVLNNIGYKTRKFERLAVPTFDGVEFFNLDDVIYCKAEGSYTIIMLKNNQQKMISKNLKDFEEILEETGFCRVHHSFLINTKHILKYIKGDGGYVILTDNHHVDVSRRKKEEFLSLMNKV